MRADWLLEPPRLFSWADIADSKSEPPATAGIYGWYFDSLPAPVPLSSCHRQGAYRLAYVGISPKAPPANGKPPSSQTVRSRVRYHFRGNAEGSTLRLTLGCLLAKDLGIELRRVGSGTRLTFGPGEAKLTDWMAEHARVVFSAHPTPWVEELRLVSELDLSLNLAENKAHPFHAALSAIRAEHKARAKALPVLDSEPA